ncbi:hypothetical protein ACIBCH_20715 [Amycolatopsis thailandensis]|uniref:hypothetical protein n=1 Tax=Amycolatopsis thailandensis TaxID=589330 RepID=UPI00379373B3
MTTPAPERPVDVYRKYLRVHCVERSPLSDAIAEAFAELHPVVLPLIEATVLKVEPGDIIVLTAAHPLTEEQADLIGDAMRDRFPTNKIALLENLQLAVVRPSRVDKSMPSPADQARPTNRGRDTGRPTTPTTEG